MAISQTIRVAGYTFEVKSTEPLTDHQRDYVADTMDEMLHNHPHVAKTLSEGRPGEPPLTVIVAKKNDWIDLSKSRLAKIARFFSPSFRTHVDTAAALYNADGNELFIQVSSIPDERVGKFKLRDYQVNANDDIRHEFSHAMDDFAVTRYTNIDRVEFGAASNTFGSSLAIEDLENISPEVAAYLRMYYGLSDKDPVEMFAATCAFLLDPARLSALKDHTRMCLHPDQEKCIQEVSKFESNPFVNGVRTFLESYPAIPGVAQSVQDDTGCWLPILRMRVR